MTNYFLLCWRAATVALLLLAAPLGAENTGTPQPLFAEDTALELEFEMDFDKICRDPSRGKCADLPAIIYYSATDGTRVRIDVKVRTRGRWRHNTGNCAFPALFVYFDREQVQGTLFENQVMLPFTTHCQHYIKRYERYTVLEYLAHRYYTLLTEASLAVRLARVNFHEPGGRKRLQRYGFFSEHFDSVAARLGVERLDAELVDPRETDPMALATLSLFQYMIGNLDWSVIAAHNIAPFKRADGEVIAIPFDFDFSGLVDAEYAAPPAKINASSVRERHYRGFCRPGIDWDALFARFQGIRPRVMSLLSETPGLGGSRRLVASRYLDKFFATIDSPKKRRQKIVNNCRELLLE